LIRPNSATATSTFSSSYAIANAINGSGLPANFTVTDAHATYSVNNHWTTAANQTIGQSATFNFTTPQSIGAFHLWAHRSNGVASNPYYVATRFDLVFRNASGAVLSTVTNIPATPNVAVAQTKFFDQVLNVSSIQYIIRETANNNSSPYTGLAEVAFEACLPCSPSVPEDRDICPGGSASFSVTPNGTGPVTYQWKRNGVNIPLAGPGGNATAQSATLVISGAGTPDVATYTCDLTNPCATVTSAGAALRVCQADFNCDAGIDFFDYLDFVAAFSSEEPEADFNADTVIDFFDYLDFVAAFSGGC
jgi:hypothetical protein